MHVKTWNNKEINIHLPAEFAGRNLLALPALVDTHVHFRTPGAEHKENWISGAKAAIHGGVTTVFDMPNTTPSTTTLELVLEKKKLIDSQLKEVEIPLHYKLYIGATSDNVDEIRKAKDEVAGIKVFMGSSTGNLLVDDRAAQDKIFAIAAELGLVVAVHGESQARIKNNELRIAKPAMSDHGLIRDPEAASEAVAQAIEMAEKYGTKTLILHTSTKGEVELIRKAKARAVPVFAETTPHHLFLTEESLTTLGSLAQMNPPLRTKEHQEALWEGVLDGTIDCVGTDHAPHLLSEKELSYPKSPSGVPGIETSLALLMHAREARGLSVDAIVRLTSQNARRIFGLPLNEASLPESQDLVIVDLDLTKTVDKEDLKTKCGWSPFEGIRLSGWPVATVLNGKVITYDNL